MRVLHFITTLDYSGAPRGVMELVREQERIGDVVPLLGVLECVEGLDGSLRNAPQIIMNESFSARRPLRALSTGRRLSRFLRDQGIDLVHSHLPSAGAVAALAARHAGIPHLAHIRGMPPWFASRAFRDRYRRAFMRVCLKRGRTRFVAVSHAAADHFRRHLLGEDSRIDVVANGVDLSAFAAHGPQPPIGEPPVVGTAGRFSWEKNFELAVHAIARLKAEGTIVELRLAGEGSHRAACERLAAELGVARQARFLGLVEDMAAFYRGLDLFVLTSRSEGLPRVAMEAGASGVPVVATAAGGTVELVEHERTGLLVPSEDLDALVAAMRRMIQDKPLRDRLREAAHTRIVRDFGVGRVARQIGQIYREMLSVDRAESD